MYNKTMTAIAKKDLPYTSTIATLMNSNLLYENITF